MGWVVGHTRGVTDPYWPLFDLRVRTPRLELRPPRDGELHALARLAAGGVHDPDTMPFLVPWTLAPSPELERNALQFWWRTRAEWSPENWHLGLAAFVDGEPVGVQDVMAQGFAVRRTVTTGSWLGRAHQGKGIGTEMRLAVLHLAFDGLGAQRAETGAWFDNEASQRVNAKLGYEPNGDELLDRMGEPTLELRFKMECEQFARIRRADVTIEGLDSCRHLFGLADGKVT